MNCVGRETLRVAMHKHREGLPYSHGDIASAMLGLQRTPYYPKHDLGAARYVAFAFSQDPTFDTSTLGERSFRFVEIHNHIVGFFLASS